MDYSKQNNEKKRKKIRSNAAKSKKKITFNIVRFTMLAILLIVIVGIAAAIGGFKGVIDSAPDITASNVMPSKLKSVMYYPDGQEAIELVGAQSNRTIVSIDDIPKCLSNAFVAIEDNRFYEHNGIDPKGIVRALFVGLSHGGNFSEGASTITQQLIKLTVFNGGAETDTMQRFKRKFQEQYDEAKADDVYSRITEVNETTKSKDIIYTWFEDAAIDQVLNDLQEKLGYTSAEANNALYSGGLQIYLTQSRHIQDIVDSYYNDDDNFPSTEYRLHWALTYKDKDGETVNIDENSLQSY